jgi:hypothetical protein
MIFAHELWVPLAQRVTRAKLDAVEAFTAARAAALAARFV